MLDVSAFFRTCLKLEKTGLHSYVFRSSLSFLGSPVPLHRRRANQWQLQRCWPPRAQQNFDLHRKALLETCFRLENSCGINILHRQGTSRNCGMRPASAASLVSVMRPACVNNSIPHQKWRALRPFLWRFFRITTCERFQQPNHCFAMTKAMYQAMICAVASWLLTPAPM